MSDIIHLLPDSVANQIAAGEVIQRPASCLKELVENSLDAGASHIRIIVRDAGRTLLQVVDDGKGMSPTDARMAFERHATSKINQFFHYLFHSAFSFFFKASLLRKASRILLLFSLHFRNETILFPSNSGSNSKFLKASSLKCSYICDSNSFENMSKLDIISSLVNFVMVFKY